VEYFDPELKYSYFVNKYISIPLSSPHVVLNRVVPGNLVSVGSKTTISATPYFFKAPLKNLSIKWIVDGKEIETDPKDPWNLNLSIASNYPKGKQIFISTVVKDIYDSDIFNQVEKDYVLITQ
jgi:hypothetical protein